jgi:CDP-diacylglycerol--glycerol-3-phosphate 3-phosphatidyltransferase
VLVVDPYIAWGTLAGWLVLLGVYGLRVATRGAAHSDRVTRIGGNALISREIMDAAYWGIAPVVRGLVAMGVTPNGLTWSAAVTGAVAGVSLGFGGFGLATALGTVSVMCDILDGQVARVTKTGSDKGELLDAAVDRYTEFFFLAGIGMFVRESAWQLGLVLAALLASFMISYSSAKAEAMKVEAPRGLMRRHERSTYLLIGAGATAMAGGAIVSHWPDLPACSPVLLACAIVAVIGNYAAVTRLVRIGRALR